ncbi:non-canonical purine NTP pyrophosphatase [Methylomonas lenta]|uniref:dITP/XTP pyrophosphatase n=1 Tax=Methylomonas lenta TaxID=980561 RepID=A0A177NGA6_9GAMM|nr:RdgB/HAM1 family non-canonical purine NTP pyrophosphatase [Methylomonas lenta]OAI16473.1 non-canonical purine NTP pyrophosphatase [Methylomonas lenta]
MTNIVLASGNIGKIREIQAILQNDKILPQSQFNVVEPEETGSTFVENAIIKARNAAKYCNLPAIADDSGLVVDALGGAPGVFSARYAGTGASDQANLDKLLIDMQGIPMEQRSARFICLMVYLRHANDPTPIIAQGVWEGRILMQAMGSNGFGYDPVFWLSDYQCSSAQLAPEVKNSLSHRGQALRILSQQLAGR